MDVATSTRYHYAEPMSANKSTERGRKALHVYCSEPVHDNWHNFAHVNGVSVSALLESIGERVEELVPDIIVRNAREIDAGRRRRGQS